MEHLYEYLIGGKKLGTNSKYKYFPKSKDELMDAIGEEIEIQGNKADLNCIDTSKIIDMSNLFRDSKFNGDISKWNVSNVKNMYRMFYNSKFNGDINKWDVSNYPYMYLIFEKSPLEKNHPKWYKQNK